MTGSTIKSTVPSDSVKQVRIMTASNTAVPVFKKGARPSLTPANRKVELNKALKGLERARPPLHKSQA